MSRRARAAMTLVATTLALVMTAVPAAHADAGSDEGRFLELTNSLRASKG